MAGFLFRLIWFNASVALAAVMPVRGSGRRFGNLHLAQQISDLNPETS